MAAVHIPGAEANLRQDLIVSPREGAFLDVPAAKTALDVIVDFGAFTGSLAFWIEGTTATGKHCEGPVNCLPDVPKEAYALRNIPEGTYTLSASIFEVPAGSAALQPRTKEELEGGQFKVTLTCKRSFSVRRFEDLKPSYEWQHLEPWQKVPPGLEISLDLNAGAGSRRAKIPESWSWDAAVAGEESTRRIVVRRAMTMAQLLEEAGLSPTSHEVVWSQPEGQQARVLEAAWTVEEVDLFRYRGQVQLRPKA